MINSRKRYTIRLANGTTYINCLIFRKCSGFRLRLTEEGIRHFVKFDDIIILNSVIQDDNDLQDKSADTEVYCSDLALIRSTTDIIINNTGFNRL